MIQKHLSFIFILLLIVSCSSSSKTEDKNILTPFQEGNLFGYKNSSGKVVIEPDYMIANEFHKEVAHVADRQKWMVINKTGKILFTPFVFDNFPDPFSEGLARFVENDKIGYYDEYGKVSVPPKFDFGYPFKGGKAKVCTGCKKVTYGEHYKYRGGKWFYIDARGDKYKPGN